MRAKIQDDTVKRERELHWITGSVVVAPRPAMEV